MPSKQRYQDVETINGLRIVRDTKPFHRGPRYSVWTPDGRCLEEFRLLRAAREWCERTEDFAGQMIEDDAPPSQ